jgi:hypothetical protein
MYCKVCEFDTHILSNLEYDLPIGKSINIIYAEKEYHYRKIRDIESLIGLPGAEHCKSRLAAENLIIKLLDKELEHRKEIASMSLESSRKGLVISDELITLVRDQTDNIEVMGEFIQWADRYRDGKERKFHCTLHGDGYDKKPSGSYNTETRVWVCSGCGGRGGNIYHFLEHYANLSFIPAVKYLANKLGYLVSTSTKGWGGVEGGMGGDFCIPTTASESKKFSIKDKY